MTSTVDQLEVIHKDPWDSYNSLSPSDILYTTILIYEHSDKM